MQRVGNMRMSDLNSTPSPILIIPFINVCHGLHFCHFLPRQLFACTWRSSFLPTPGPFTEGYYQFSGSFPKSTIG